MTPFFADTMLVMTKGRGWHNALRGAFSTNHQACIVAGIQRITKRGNSGASSASMEGETSMDGEVLNIGREGIG
jgi:hypothetical protein